MKVVQWRCKLIGDTFDVEYISLGPSMDCYEQSDELRVVGSFMNTPSKVSVNHRRHAVIKP